MDNHNRDTRLDKAISWGIPFLLSLIVGYQQLQYQQQHDATKDLENKFYTLVTEKVSKGELKETENRLQNSINALSNEQRNRAAADKADIIARLELIARMIKK